MDKMEFHSELRWINTHGFPLFYDVVDPENSQCLLDSTSAGSTPRTPQDLCSPQSPDWYHCPCKEDDPPKKTSWVGIYNAHINYRILWVWWVSCTPEPIVEILVWEANPTWLILWARCVKRVYWTILRSIKAISWGYPNIGRRYWLCITCHKNAGGINPPIAVLYNGKTYSMIGTSNFRILEWHI